MKREEVIVLINEFYDNEYNNLKKCVKKIEIARVRLEVLKDKEYNLILATNPEFPKSAIEKRLSWGNIDKTLFSYFTSYENSCYCKPNENYYKEILINNNIKKEKTIMVGNDCFF